MGFALTGGWLRRYRGWPGCRAAWPVPAAVMLCVFAAFLPVLGNGFVNWDDDFTLLFNARYRGLDPAHIKWMFTTFYMGHYQPLSWLTFALDYRIWGLDPRGFHLTSLLLHCANAALFFAAARLILKAASPGRAADAAALCGSAAFAALLFALHPLRVESVAWATERRDTLSAFFLLLTVISYLRACEAGERGRLKYLLPALCCYPLSLLSKGIGVSLPAVLIALDIYPLRRLPASPGLWLEERYRGVWLEKLPFAALSLAAGVTGLFAQVSAGAITSLNVGGIPPLPARLLQGLYALGAYAWKTLLPFNLLPLYERLGPAAAQPWHVYAGAAGAAAITFYAVARRRSAPAPLTAWFCYTALLLPVLQIVPFGPYIIADRYTYLACLPLALLGGGALLNAPRERRVYALAAAAVILAALGALTWRQTRIWKDPGTLWGRVIAANPGSSIAHNNLGAYLSASGRHDEAAREIGEALRLRPDYAGAHYNMGAELATKGSYASALGHYREALRLNPASGDAAWNIARLLEIAGDAAQARTYFALAAELQPADPLRQLKLAGILAAAGDMAGAEKRYSAALAAGSPQAHAGLCVTLAARGALREAVPHCAAAAELSPGDKTAQFNLAELLAASGDSTGAAGHYREVLRIDPLYGRARTRLEELERASGARRR